MMNWKLPWRNIWRNKRRSVIVIISVAVGVIATVLTDTMSRGMIFQMLDNQIGSHVAHVQIHMNGFKDNPVVRNFIPDPPLVEHVIKAQPDILYFSRRVLTYGLIGSARSSSGISLIGVDPDREKFITTIGKSIVAGSYLSGSTNEIVVGHALAEKLDVGIGDKIIAMASALDGRVGMDVFRIVGLFETMSSEFDKSFVYIPLSNAKAMLNLGNNVSEYALILKNRNSVSSVCEKLADELGNKYEVLSYPQVLPFLTLQIDLYRESMFIFYGIIGVALLFGIVNTMLMSVFERIREFGVLKATGMKDGQIFLLVMYEALLLGIIGTVIGFIVGYAAYLPLAKVGLDLSMFSESLRSFGVGTIIYPVLTWDVIANALIIIPLITVLGALYPAFRTVRLQPVHAMRYV